MESNLGSGAREDLEELGRQLDKSAEDAVALTEKVLRIRNRRGQCVALAANRAQKRYARDSWEKQRNIVLKARQMGMSTWIAGQFFLKTITHPGTVTVQVAHTQEAAEQIFRIVRRFMANLPRELRAGVLRSAHATARRLAMPELDSEYLVETAGDRNAGRGMTITQLHCTELARWPGDAEETLHGLAAALSPAGSLAMESTPMGASGCFWREWRDAEKTDTVRHFFPWWMETGYSGPAAAEESLTEEERQVRAQHGLTLEQIGYRRQIRESYRGLAEQEFAEDPETCFVASGSCYFETRTIDRRLASLPEPIAMRGRGAVLVWLPPQPGRQYLVAVDPAGGGTAGDYTAMQVIDLETAMQCAELQAHLTPAEAAREAAGLAREYNGALLAVERNNMGTTVIACAGGMEHYAHLYVHEDGVEGMLTTAVARTAMLSEMYKALEEAPRNMMSERLLRECRSFVRLENGRVEAQAGEHDDLVLAMGIALLARKNHLGRRGGR
jgi:hypothetical protein